MGQRSLIVLDTHAWIWHVAEDSRLSVAARRRIRAADVLGVHPISCWEVAMLIEHRRLRVRQTIGEWVEAALDRPKIALIPFTAGAAVRAAGLGEAFPGDPADRFIAAAALELDAPLATADQSIARWGGVKVVW